MALPNPASSLSLLDYALYDDATQMERKIDRYPLSFTRTPNEPLIRRPLTRSERTGPSEMHRFLPMSATGPDLSRPVPYGPLAIGQRIWIEGRVVDEDGRPIPNAVMEIWQANSAGRYIHEMDDNLAAPVDPNFLGTGRLQTGNEGEFRLLTVKPGAYPVIGTGWWWRPPHIHFSIFGTSWMDRYVTQIFFPGEPLNQTDLLFNGVRDEEARQRLLFEPLTPTIGKSGDVNAPSLMGYKLDFVLRGKRATPEVD
jgi:protocatechuate 3,4-dioxygenase, beta subunit